MIRYRSLTQRTSEALALVPYRRWAEGSDIEEKPTGISRKNQTDNRVHCGFLRRGKREMSDFSCIRRFTIFCRECAQLRAGRPKYGRRKDEKHNFWLRRQAPMRILATKKGCHRSVPWAQPSAFLLKKSTTWKRHPEPFAKDTRAAQERRSERSLMVLPQAA